MSFTLANFLEFDRTPFKDGIELFCYSPLHSKMKYQEVGNTVRLLRAKNKENPIFHYGMEIYSLFKIDNYSPYFESNYVSKENIILSIKEFENEKNRTLCEFLLGAVILNKLMRDPSTFWKIQESSTYSIYEIEKYYDTYYLKSQKRNIAIYKGFIFRPFILRPNRIGVFIDCKTSMFYVNDLTDRKLVDMLSNSEDKDLVDFCPDQECPQMRNSFSLCNLSTPTGGRKFVMENDMAVIDTLIQNEIYVDEDYEPDEMEESLFEEPSLNHPIQSLDENQLDNNGNDECEVENLIQYHDRFNVCPEHRINGCLDPKNKSIHVTIKDKPYDFPPERLKPKVSLHRLNKTERSNIMGEIVLPPHQRLKNILTFVNQTINVLKYKNYLFLATKPIYYQHDRSLGRFSKLHLSPLKLHSITSRAPAHDLVDDKPYDYETRQKTLNLLFLYIGRISSEEYKEIHKYEWQKELKEFFKFDEVTLDNFEEEVAGNKDFDYHKDRLDNYDCILIVHGEHETSPKVERKIFEKLYEVKKPAQGINISNFIEKFEQDVTTYFWNILLGIYSKCGFIAWKLGDNEEPDKRFIGINLKSSKLTNERFISLTLYTTRGILEKIVYKRCMQDEFQLEFTNSIQNLLDDCPNPLSSVYCLFLGSSQENDREIVRDYLGQKNISPVNFEIHKNSYFRLFDELNNRIKQVKAGSCCVIPSENVAFFTSMEPRSGTAAPIKIQFIPQKENSFVLNEDIQKIFDLTQCYTGYVNYRIRLPLPVYAAEKVMNELRKNNVSEYIDSKPFFI